MLKRNLGIIVTRSLISIFLFILITLIIININTEKTVKNLILDIYDYSDSVEQKTTIKTLSDTCDSLLTKDEKINDQLITICPNTDTIIEAQKNCKRYYELLVINQTKKNEVIEKSCGFILANDIYNRCDKFNKLVSMNLTFISIKCEQHLNKLITDRDFFESMFAQKPKFSSEKLSPIVLILILIILLSLSALLVIFHKEKTNSILFSFGRILFHIGILICLIYLIVQISVILNKPDTGLILRSFLSNSEQGIYKNDNIAITLAQLIFIRLFNSLYLISGIVLVMAGLSLKIVFKKGKI